MQPSPSNSQYTHDRSLDSHDRSLPISDRLLYPDFIRSTAILLIMIIHVGAGAFYTFSDKWNAANLFDSFSRIGVPLFFMLSGALLIGKEEYLHVFFQKRFVKVVIPLIIWSIFYWAWRTYYYGQTVSGGIWSMFVEPLYFHLGFIYIILSLYLAAPIVRLFYPSSSTYIKMYYIIIALVVTGILPFMSVLTGITKFIFIDFSFFSGWIAYFILGKFITECKTNLYRWIFFSVFIVGSLSTTLLTYWWSHQRGTPNELFYLYLSPNVVVAAIGMFGFLVSFEENLKSLSPTLQKAMISVSQASFGIYLIHPVILELLASPRIAWLSPPLTANLGNPYLSIPLIALLCLGISFGIVFFMQKIPLLKWAVP